MKTTRFAAWLVGSYGLALGFCFAAQNTVPTASTSNAVAAAPASSEAGLAPVSSAQWDIIKLTKAGVGEQTILAYIANSGRSYQLTPEAMVQLKNQGVSDAVLTAMLQQDQKLAGGGLTKAPSYPASSATSPGSGDYGGAAYTPASMTYVIPSSGATYSYPYSYYGYYPYSYPYWGGYYNYWYPGLSFSLGLGYGCYGGYYGYPNGCGGRGWYYGGYHGGRYYPGGHHGGGPYYRGGYRGSPGYHGGTPYGGGYRGGAGYRGGSGYRGGMPHGPAYRGGPSSGGRGGGTFVAAGRGGGGRGGHR